MLAQAATAATVGCSWCLDFGYYLAHSEGMDLEKIREVMRWRDSDVFSPVEREVLGYAEAMSTTPLTVTDEMVASLLDHLGEEALVELTMMIAIENERARFNSAAGLQAQGYSDVCEVPLPGSRPCTPYRRAHEHGQQVRHRRLRRAPEPAVHRGVRDARLGGRRRGRAPGDVAALAEVDKARSGTTARTSSGSPHGSRSTACARWLGSAKPTSARGCPSRC